MRSTVLRETQERRARRERALNMRFAGVPFRDHTERRAAAFMSDLAEDLYEAFTFAHLAVGAGIDELINDIVKCSPPRPDLLVSLQDGSSVYVEVGRVRALASGRHFGEIQALNKGLLLAAKADSTIARQVEGRHISFGMPTVPTKADRQTVVAELIETLRSLKFDNSQPWTLMDAAIAPKPAKRMRLNPDPSIAPTLANLKVTIDVAEVVREEERSTYVTVSSRAGIGSPSSSVVDFDSELQAKTTRLYETGLIPIWLAMPLDDDMQVPAPSIESIRAALPTNLGPFARVIVGTLDDAEVIDRQ